MTDRVTLPLAATYGAPSWVRALVAEPVDEGECAGVWGPML
jgi:hypothetical protein